MQTSRGALATGLLVGLVVLLAERPSVVEGHLKRCISCRSRGDLGSCKDPFTMNATQIENEKGVEAVPCASGWCVKVIESQSLQNEYGTATERSCLQRGPDDNEERCAFTMRNYKKVYMCFCNGDMCNSATSPTGTQLFLVLLGALVLGWARYC